MPHTQELCLIAVAKNRTCIEQFPYDEAVIEVIKETVTVGRA